MHQSAPPNLVVFLTGAFVSHRCWDEWLPYFTRRGYTCYAPAWPHKAAPAAELRRQHPHSPIAANGLLDVLRTYTDFIRQLPSKPIVIGHSYGGLLAQLLLQQDMAAAGVAIESVPPQGVLVVSWSFVRSVLPSLGLLTSSKSSILLSFKHWQYAIANGLPLAEQQASYERLITPESKKMAWEALTKRARVDFTKPHAPLLLLAGSADRLMPAALNYANYRRYQPGHSVTDYQELPGRNHALLGLPTWTQDADLILNWLAKNTPPANGREPITA